VDDGLVIGASLYKINNLLLLLKKRFKITHSEANFYLGLEISRDRFNKITRVHQTSHTMKILQKFNMANCNCISTPMDAQIVLKRELKEENKIIKDEDFPYRQLILVL